MSISSFASISSSVMHALPVLLPLGVCTFVGLFAYDVYRTSRAADQPQRMFSELAFNGLLRRPAWAGPAMFSLDLFMQLCIRRYPVGAVRVALYRHNLSEGCIITPKLQAP